jgi:WD40 repeat protein
MSTNLCINPRCPQPKNHLRDLFCKGCGSQLLLEGRYWAKTVLGEGRFGKTYEVSHNGVFKVLKVLKLDRISPTNQAKVLSLFQQEVKVLIQLDRPGIPKGDRYFQYWPKDSQAPLHCLVMEKIEGMNLWSYINQQGHPIDRILAVRWLVQLTKILEQVHEQNFFHRDIKPTNIMLKPDGELVLIDFGTARELTDTYYAKQHQGQITGVTSAGYTPPEQLSGRAVPASDFFALGRTFVYLLTGKEPTTMYDPYTNELEWHDLVPDLLPELADLLDRLMASDPEDRPTSSQEIVEQLAEIWQILHPGSPSTLPTQPAIRDRAAIVWQNAQLDRTLAGRSQSVKPVTANSTNRYANIPLPDWTSGNWKTTINLCSTVAGEEISALKGHSGWLAGVRSVAFSPDGQLLASASEDTTIKIWNLKTGEEVFTLKDPVKFFAGVRCVAFSPSPQQVAMASGRAVKAPFPNLYSSGDILVSAGEDRNIKVWDLTTGKKIRTLAGHLDAVTCVAFSPNGKMLASGSNDKTIKLWNLAAGYELCTLEGYSGWINSVAFSPDGRILASGDMDGKIKLWDLSTAQEICTLSGHLSWVESVAFSPDKETLASGSGDNTIVLWNWKTQQKICTLTGHLGLLAVVNSVAFSPDGQVLASGSCDRTVKLWNLKTGQEIQTLTGHLGSVFSVTFSPDGQTLASGSHDGTIKIWQVFS